MLAVPAWSVMNWSTVYATLEQFKAAMSKARPMKASFYDEKGTGTLRKGQALWMAETSCGPIGLAWDWAEVADGVPAMMDPMTILSNVALTDSEGCLLGPSEAILQLNSVIYGLPWQQAVLEHSSPSRVDGAVALASGMRP